MIENGQAGSPASPRRGRAAKSFRLLPCLALVLQGCNKSPTPDWLAGSWIPAELSCNSSFGDIFERNGIWRAEDQDGTWKLDAGNLIISVTGAMDADGVRQPANETYALRITSFDENSFSTASSGKTPAIKWKRCSFGHDQTSSAPSEPATPVFPQVTALLEANDPKVCATDEVQQIVLSSIAGNYDDYLAEGGKPGKLRAVNATGIKAEIHEVSCSANIKMTQSEFSVSYVVRPSLSNDGEFVVSDAQTQRGWENALWWAIENSRQLLKGPTPAAEPSEPDASARADAAAKASEAAAAAAAEAAAAASGAAKH